MDSSTYYNTALQTLHVRVHKSAIGRGFPIDQLIKLFGGAQVTSNIFNGLDVRGKVTRANWDQHVKPLLDKHGVGCKRAPRKKPLRKPRVYAGFTDEFDECFAL